MISAFFRLRSTFVVGPALVLALAVPALPIHGQTEHHGRKYKPLAPAATVTVMVQRASNGKPIDNASVVFRASKQGKEQGSLEVKTNEEGKAKIDIIEVGSHVEVQVIADGFATNATDFDVTSDEKSVVLKMEKPRAQVSAYEDNDGKAASRQPGVQEPRPMVVPKKTPPATPATAAPQTAPPASSPQ
jgi:Carboxypeptidase regulatory-like domain